MARFAYLLLLLPTLAYAQPEVRDIREPVDMPVFTSGLATFGLSYGISTAVASDSGDGRHIHDLYVPVAGPWMALADRGGCPAIGSCDNETTKKILLVADGVFQAAGVVTMIDAFVSPPHRSVVVQSAKIDTKLHFAPTLVGMNRDPGFAVSGHF
ncbi:MAG TPA: hypothetical protein VGM88_09810 [Kofleriaceae bacterium]|jgi:hypothetical protein